MTEDLAIVTALHLLEGMVCECGHLNTEHMGACCDCVCSHFQAVNFFVQRADAADDEDER